MAARRFGPEFHEPAEDDDEFACPAPGCDRVFDSEKGRNIHHGIVHPDRIRDPVTCQHCGDEFERRADTTNTYCSSECAERDSRDRVTVTCEHCGDGFEVFPHEADARRYCSQACSGAADRIDPVTLECKHCGDAFDVPQRDADRRVYCSIDCSTAANKCRERRECNACGRGFTVNPARTVRHCSTACRSETMTSAPRPVDVEGLLWLLYVYEGHNARDTWLRANANLDPDDQLTLRETKQQLRDNHWMRGGGVARYENLEPEDVGLTSRDQTPQDKPWQKYYQPATDGGDAA